MSDVFLSYSRKDTTFVKEIFEALSARQREAWIDLHDIDYSAKWCEEICNGIDGADNFVLFVSPNSLGSLFCHREIQHALKHNKRIIPFLLKEIDQEAMFQAWQSSPDLSRYEQLAHENWQSIQELQWIDYTQINDVNLAVDTLLKTVDADPERVKLHTRLLLRLHDWESRGRNPSGLLRGDELTHYEKWFNESRQIGTPPHPTDEQAAYIAESRRAQDESEAKRIQRERLIRRFRTASSILGVFFILAIIATVLTTGVANRAVTAQQTSIAKEGQANTQVALSGVTLQAGNTQIAAGNTQVAVIGQTLTPIPPQLTAVAQTIIAGNYMIESLNLSGEANTILHTEGGNADTAALLSIRVLRKVYLSSADSALVEAISRMKAVSLEFAYDGAVSSVGFSPDGKTFLLGINKYQEAGAAELRDSTSGKAIWKHAILPPAVYSVAFSPNGKLIVAAGGDHTAMIWDASNGKTVRVLKGHSDVVQKAVFSPDNKNVLTLGGNNDLTVRLWDVETGKQIYSVPSGRGFPTLFFFPDGQTFYAGDNFYNTSDGRLIQGKGGIMAISPDGKSLVTGINLEADLLDTNSLQVIRTFSGHIDSITSAAFSGDGKWLVTGSKDNTARVWEVASGKLVQILSGHAAMVGAVAFSPDGTKVLTGSTTARLWSLDGGNQQKTLSVPAGVSTSALSPDGTTILVGDAAGNSGLWDLNAGQLSLNFPIDNGGISSVAFSPDGKMVAFQGIGSANSSVLKIYDPLNGTLLKTITADSVQSPIGSLAFSSDSKMIFAWNFDDIARLWDIASGKVLRQFNGKDTQNHIPAAFSPDGKLVALDGGRTWWNISTGLEIAAPGGMNGTPSIFSEDGSLFADADPVKNVSVWKVSTQELIHSFSGHTDLVTSLAISSDNRLLLTGSADKTARLWDISTGQLLRVFSGHTAAVTSVAFTPDGKKIVTGSLDKTIRTWITDYNDLLAYACTRVVTDFTAQERVLFGISDQDPTCPQFGKLSQPLMPTTTLIPTRTPLPQWTPMPTATPEKSQP